MKLFIFGVFFITIVFANDPEFKNLNEYLKMMQKYSTAVGSTANAKETEIELLKDPNKIKIGFEKTKEI